MTDWLAEVNGISKELTAESIPHEWNKVLLDGFYKHQNHRLFKSMVAFSEKYGVPYSEMKTKVLYPSFYVQDMTLLRFISGYVPKLAKVCYSHTEADIPKILEWMKGRKFRCVRDIKSAIETAEKQKDRRDFKHKLESDAITQKIWDKSRSGNWGVCK